MVNGHATSNLEAIKAKMTPQQRKDMAELLAGELKKRQDAKVASGVGRKNQSAVRESRLGEAISEEQLKSIRDDVNTSVTSKRLKQIDKELADLRSKKKKESQGDFVKARMHWIVECLSRRNALLIVGVVVFGLGKLFFLSRTVSASVDERRIADSSHSVVSKQIVDAVPMTAVADRDVVEHHKPEGEEPFTGEGEDRRATWSPEKRELLTQLDARRVQLEKRRIQLDEREKELRNQEEEIAGKLVELKMVARKLEEYRQQKDHQYEARLEQLADVYGSMAPKEAAPLIEKLEENIALALLERMPGKRMGQILSLMSAERAVELTKKLTSKQLL